MNAIKSICHSRSVRPEERVPPCTRRDDHAPMACCAWSMLPGWQQPAYRNRARSEETFYFRKRDTEWRTHLHEPQSQYRTAWMKWSLCRRDTARSQQQRCHAMPRDVIHSIPDHIHGVFLLWMDIVLTDVLTDVSQVGSVLCTVWVSLNDSQYVLSSCT